MEPITSPTLSELDKREVFRIATRSFPKLFAAQIEQGMSDDELGGALSDYLGEFGGSSGPGRLSVTYARSGLRIWGGWHIVNHYSEKPLFAGSKTVEMAREIYQIRDPSDQQQQLL